MSGEVLEFLSAYHVKLHPDHFIRRINQTESLAAKPMHLPVTIGRPAVRHHGHDLMQAFPTEAPEVPYGSRALAVGVMIALLSMNKIRKLLRIPNKKNRRVVAHQVPVPVVGIIFHGEAPGIAFRIRAASFAGHGGKTKQHPCLLTDLAEDFRLGIFCDIGLR